MLNKYDLVSYYAADDDSDIILNPFLQYHTPFTVMYYMYALSNIKKINELQDILSHFFLQSCHVFGICEIDSLNLDLSLYAGIFGVRPNYNPQNPSKKMESNVMLFILNLPPPVNSKFTTRP